jgi:hypothetical protein
MGLRSRRPRTRRVSEVSDMGLGHLESESSVSDPLFLHKKKSDSFIEIKDRIFSKIMGWKARLLSQAVRTTLVKSVANAIPTYLMSIFFLPKSFCGVINSSLRKFWWGFPQDKKHNLSFLAWNSICQPKSQGGLGL